MANYTTINIKKSYVQGTTQLDIYIENKGKNIYLHATAWNYETRNSWGHKGELWGHIGDEQVGNEKKIVYYNRTWESYRFQSLIHSLLRSTKTSKANKQLLEGYCDKIDAKARKMYI